MQHQRDGPRPRRALIDHAPLNISVSPSARDDGQFLVTAQGIDAYHQQLVDDNAERAERAASEEADKVAEEKLTALVKPGWLIGLGFGAKAGSDAAHKKAISASSKAASRLWRRCQLPLDDAGSPGQHDWCGRSWSFDITDADNNTMSTLFTDGETQDFRRCAPSEIQAAGQPDPETETDTMPSVDPSDGDTSIPSGG